MCSQENVSCVSLQGKRDDEAYSREDEENTMRKYLWLRKMENERHRWDIVDLIAVASIIVIVVAVVITAMKWMGW